MSMSQLPETDWSESPVWEFLLAWAVAAFVAVGAILIFLAFGALFVFFGARS